MENKKTNKIILIVGIILLFAICYFFPYTHDDWAWGTHIGIDRLTSLFENYNGRWLGNLLVLLLTRSRVLRALTITLTLVGIIYLIKKITSSKDTSTNIGIILLLSMPISIIAQAISWTSGFANYVPPVLTVLYFIYLNKNVFDKNEYSISNKLIIPLSLLGFISSLFIEHVTIYNLIISIALLIYVKLKKQKNSLANIGYAIGSTIGTIFMFSNGAYHQIASSADGYRTIEQGNIITRTIKTYFEELYHFMVHNNIVLNIFLCITLITIIYIYFKKNKKINKIIKIILNICNFIFIGYLMYILYTKVMSGGNIFIYPKYKKYLEGIMIGAYLISIFATIILTTKDKVIKNRLIFEYISIILVTAPLLIVTPIGARCFLPTYVFMTLLAVDLFNTINIKENINFKTMTLIMVGLLLICNFSIYGYIYKVDFEKVDYIQKHSKDEKIVLPILPYGEYLQGSTPRSEVFKIRFKKFYKINQDTKIEFINYTKWVKEYKSE